MGAKTPRTPEQAARAQLYFDEAIETIRAAARGCGYAIGVHGSIARDIDLIAVPWVEHATSAERLVEAVRTAMTVGTGIHWIVVSEPRKRPHGRLSWSLMFVDFERGHHGPHTYVDLSVVPLYEEKPPVTFATGPEDADGD